MKEISSAQHPLVKYWVKLKEDSRFRKSEKSVLLEGRNAIEDICARITAKRIITRSINLVSPTILTDEIVVVSDQILKKLSHVEQSDGLIAELPLPEEQSLDKKSRLLVCDRIQDPGNLGTLLRTALAFGWQGVFLLPGCCDPFNDKALRSAKGATFFLPIQTGDWDTLSTLVHNNNLSLVAADMYGSPPSSFSKGAPIALVLSNESQGIKIPSEISHQTVALEMAGQMESLNVAVAGSILMYLL